MTKWTSKLPEKDGYYWVRWTSFNGAMSSPSVAEWDGEMQWLELTGSDVFIAPEDFKNYGWQIWPVAITPPPAQ